MSGYAKNRRKDNAKTGSLGERIVAQYLINRGFAVLDRNYRQPFSEIDLIVKKAQIVHFVEVKSVSYETKVALEWAVTHETWRPEELVHGRKLHQIGKGVEAWLSETGYTGNWQIDVATVRIVPRETFATVKIIPNVVASE